MDKADSVYGEKSVHYRKKQLIPLNFSSNGLKKTKSKTETSFFFPEDLEKSFNYGNLEDISFVKKKSERIIEDGNPEYHVVPQGIWKENGFTTEDPKKVRFSLPKEESSMSFSTKMKNICQRKSLNGENAIILNSSTYEQVVNDTKLAREYCENHGIRLDEVNCNDENSDPLFPLTQNFNSCQNNIDLSQEVPGEGEWSHLEDNEIEVVAMYEEAKEVMQKKRHSFEIYR